MQNRFIEISVGLLMLAGMAALAFLALQVSSRTFAQNQGGYEVVAYFTNVAGLTETGDDQPSFGVADQVRCSSERGTEIGSERRGKRRHAASLRLEGPQCGLDRGVRPIGHGGCHCA